MNKAVKILWSIFPRKLERIMIVNSDYYVIRVCWLGRSYRFTVKYVSGWGK